MGLPFWAAVLHWLVYSLSTCSVPATEIAFLGFWVAHYLSKTQTFLAYIPIQNICSNFFLSPQAFFPRLLRWNPSRGILKVAWWVLCWMDTCACESWWCRGPSWSMRPRICCWRCWRTWPQVAPLGTWSPGPPCSFWVCLGTLVWFPWVLQSQRRRANMSTHSSKEWFLAL